MPQVSCGILMYRVCDRGVEVLLVHPGGPFWKNKDAGAWSIPKGLVAEGEDLLAGAVREFAEETGFAAPPPFVALGAIRQKSGKLVHAWACAGEVDATLCRSNTCEVQWPPNSGKWITVPEVDAARWFGMEDARVKINPAQVELLDRLTNRISGF